MNAPPARPRTSPAYRERVAYLKLHRGEITIEEYRAAIAPRPRRRRLFRARA